MTQIAINQEYNNKTLDVRIGDFVLIGLEENPTTGYLWRVEQTEKQIISIEDSKFRASGNGIGAGGVLEPFFLKYVSPGTSKISCRLKRGWEGGHNPIKQFQVFINVRKSSGH